MEAMMITLSPAEGRDLLNGVLTVLVRKKFPINYTGWVYVYIKNDKKYQLQKVWSVGRSQYFYTLEREKECSLNGKVVARFYCNNVETIFAKPDRYKEFYFYDTCKLDMEDLLKQSCLEYNDLDIYLEADDGRAIYIAGLERFKDLKELKDFAKPMPKNDFICHKCPHYWTDDSAGYSIDKCGLDVCEKLQLKQAPKTYCYIETPSNYIWLEEK